MTIQVTIIMNSYNRFPQCLYTLYSLEFQTFDPAKMEVIFVDDASTDDSCQLANYQPPYHFQYIRLRSNHGRSKAKNIGLQHASGEIIIFLDAELLVEPHFIEMRYQHHLNEQTPTVATCFSHYASYTVFEKGFNHQQKLDFVSKVRPNLGKLSAHAQNAWKRLPVLTMEKVGLFEKDDFEKQSYKHVSFKKAIFPELIHIYGNDLTGFHFPWVCTFSPLSMKKTIVDEVGGFYEGFLGYGTEDWEFGYRLYKHGVKLINSPSGFVYHQEHPRNLVINNQEGIPNFLTFFKKYNDFEIAASIFIFWLGKDWSFSNDLIKEYHQVLDDNPEPYQEFFEVMIRLLEAVLEQVIAGKGTHGLVQASNMDEHKWKAAQFQKEELQKNGNYQQLSNAMDFLLSL
ncbi:glycosyltransferase family 2 protein [Neobacillus pocheonensis]|uniref:glycosyltransferase family 2 protein n=1 Tax=Neobacillus pocheonensis TaxID=363869 RepID=UPI003D2DAACB